MERIVETAQDKIRDEMAKEANNPGIQYIGEWLTQELAKRPGIGEKVLAEGKTLKGAFEKIWAYAAKHKVGNFAFVPPEKGLALAGEYYGLEKQESQALGIPAGADDDLDLDALLGGL